MKKTLLLGSLMGALAVTGCSSTSASNEQAPTVTSSAIAAVTANSHDKAHVASNVLDDNFGTRWAQKGEAWIQFDFNGEQTLSYVDVAAFKGDERKLSFDLQVSNDGKAWKTVLPETATSGTTRDLERFEFSPVKAKYARINGYGTDVSKSWTAITEVKF